MFQPNIAYEAPGHRKRFVMEAQRHGNAVLTSKRMCGQVQMVAISVLCIRADRNQLEEK